MRKSKFTTSQKRKAVAKFAKGTSIETLSTEYGIHPRTIYIWKQELMKKEQKVTPSGGKKVKGRLKTSSKTSLLSLKQENTRLKLAYNNLTSKVREIYSLVS